MTDIIRQEAKAISDIPYTPAYDKAIDLIMEYVHHRGGKLICSGMGKAGQIARNVATTFSSTGTPAVYLHPTEAQHGDLGVLQTNDIMLLISNSGRTREVLQLVDLAKIICPDIPVIVITGDPDSELQRLSDVTLLTGGAPEVCTLGLTPTTSITVMTVMCDILVVNVMRLIGFTAADYAKRHHGGNLGHISRVQTLNDPSSGDTSSCL